MTIQITIIGLGQIGASIGMALGKKPDLIQRIGYDIDPQVMRKAPKIGVVDKITNRLEQAVQNTDVLLLALPTDEIRSTMEELLPLMKPGAIVLETAVGKEQLAAWAVELLPKGCSYVGLTPVINPKYLFSSAYGIDSAHPDLFQNGMITITTPPNTDAKAIKFAADLAKLMDANVLFADMLEVDSIMSATHIVPQLLAAALLNTTVNQPNWREAGKMAGRAYAEVSGPIEHLGLPGTLAASAIQNREHVLRVLNSVLASIRTLRNDINAQDTETLNNRLERAYLGREQWWQDRHPQKKENMAYPEERLSISSMLFGDLLGNRKRKSKNENLDS
jgi:prephenate dehydrogenase